MLVAEDGDVRCNDLCPRQLSSAQPLTVRRSTHRHMRSDLWAIVGDPNRSLDVLHWLKLEAILSIRVTGKKIGDFDSVDISHWRGVVC